MLAASASKQLMTYFNRIECHRCKLATRKSIKCTTCKCSQCDACCNSQQVYFESMYICKLCKLQMCLSHFITHQKYKSTCDSAIIVVSHEFQINNDMRKKKDFFSHNRATSLLLNGHPLCLSCCKLRKNQCITNLKLFNNKIRPLEVVYVLNTIMYSRSIRILNLNTNLLGNKGTKILCEGLITYPCSITELDMGTNIIHNQGAHYIALLISKNKTIQTLNLYSNAIEDKGAQEIIDSLMLNRVLQGLILSRNKITGIILSKNISIKQLYLAENHITNLDGFTSWLRTFKEGDKGYLNLKYNDIDEKAAKKIIYTLKGVRVNIHNHTKDDEDLIVNDLF